MVETLNIVSMLIYKLFLSIFFFYLKEYKRLEREINANWSEKSASQQHQPQTSGIILSSATSFTEKSPNTH